MAEIKVVQFCLLISLMIFSTPALDVLLSDGIGGYECSADIKIECDPRGKGSYFGCNINKNFTAGDNTTKVLVYIAKFSTMRKILYKKYREKREEIADILRKSNYELLYLAVSSFHKTYNHADFIAEFLLMTIVFNRNLKSFEIVTIGEGKLNANYTTSLGPLKQYQEEEDIFGGDLQGQLRSIHAKILTTK